MFHRGKWLLATFIFTTVSQLKVTAVNLIQKEINSSVVDDMYEGCRSKAMEKFISSGLLQKELAQDEEFQKAWKANNCSKQIPGGQHEHSAAISAYTDESQIDFPESFDKAVKTMGVNTKTYTDNFHFKSLHFLLMDSMTLLKPHKCRTTFAFFDEGNTPRKGSTVKFESFITVYATLKDLESVDDLYDRTVLNITTCFFVDLETHSCSQHKSRVLLSPAELFSVTAIEQIEDNDSDTTVVVLKHLKLHSEHNCRIFPEVTDPVPTVGGQKSRAPAVVSTQWLLSVFVALMFFMNF